MNDFETTLPVMASFAMGRMVLTARVVWILYRPLKAEAEGNSEQ
jgi:hypothetical protein